MSLEKEQPPNHHMTTSQQHIPDEIIVDVLLRLRVKPLLRCKSVSKSWYSFISDPQFVKSHFTKSTTNNDYVHHRLMLLTTKPDNNVKTCSLNDALYHHTDTTTLEELDYPAKQYDRAFSIVGSCNGLFCIAFGRDDVFIWNPSTRKSIKLPNCDSEPLHCWYGFGYDESSDDYKVVVLYTVYKGGVKSKSKVRIYSLKTGKWKIVVGFPSSLAALYYCRFFNGAFYWFVSHYENTLDVIVSLDLANETYSIVSRPVFDVSSSKAFGFGVLGERLCMTCGYIGSRTDVWVMESKDSWAKLVSIPHLTDSRTYQVSMPLFISKDGKLLLKINEKLGLYDPRDTSFLEFQNFGKDLRAYIFVENLVSLDGIADNNDDGN